MTTEEFWRNVQKTILCWNWTGWLDAGGYGRPWISEKQTKVLAHRFAYEKLVGPIPSGMELDHLCRNCRCVNPLHLEPVTHAENMKRGIKAQQSHCIHGHPLNKENTYLKPNGCRMCRACNRESTRRYKQSLGTA